LFVSGLVNAESDYALAEQIRFDVTE
jgi:hypothetical protein